MTSGVTIFVVCLIITLIVSIIAIIVGVKEDSAFMVVIALILPVCVCVYHAIDTKIYSSTEYNIEQMATDYNAEIVVLDGVNQPTLKYYGITDEWVYYLPAEDPQAQYKLEG